MSWKRSLGLTTPRGWAVGCVPVVLGSAFVFWVLLRASEMSSSTWVVLIVIASVIGLLVVGARRMMDEQKARLEAEELEYEIEKTARRSAALTKRFGADAAARIVEGSLWQGATADMVREIHGMPADTETKVLRDVRSEVWKYERVGKSNRFRLRVYLENGVVIGWQSK